MKFTLSLYGILIFGNALAQLKTTLYYNEFWWLQPSKSANIKYQRKCTVDTVNGGFMGEVKDYEKVGKNWVLIMEGRYGTVTEYGRVKHPYNGDFVYYYKNGTKRSEGKIENGSRSGVWNLFYKNGNLRASIRYEGQRGFAVLESYDRDGKKNERKGLALHEDAGEPARTRYESKADQRDLALMKEFPFLKKFGDNTYERDLKKLLVEYPADDSRPNPFGIGFDFDIDFPGGIEHYTKMLRDKIVYPPQALKDKTEGLVIVSVMIGNDGAIEEAKVITDIGGGCGAEAERLIREAPKFWPARKDNKRIKKSMLVPVYFELP